MVLSIEWVLSKSQLINLLGLFVRDSIMIFLVDR